MYITYLSDRENKQAVTVLTDILTEKNLEAVDKMLPYVYHLYEMANQILSQGDLSKRYKTTHIRKQNGKMRRIDSPDEELKSYMQEVVDVFTNKLNLIFPECTYAYIKSRSTKNLVERNQEATKILKLDIKDFFNSCTLDFIINSMEKVYPFCVMDTTILEVIVKVCMLQYDGEWGLPQGAPTSPILSNIAMIPIDYYFDNIYKNYSRYSDDIFISYKKREVFQCFDIFRHAEEIQNWLRFNNSKFNLNEDKTKLINIEKSGGVWILGIMLNKEHNITIGSKNKQWLKAYIFSFLMDVKNGNVIEKQEAYRISGIVGYYKYIEPEYVEMTIRKYEEKVGLNYYQEIENIIFS